MSISIGIHSCHTTMTWTVSGQSFSLVAFCKTILMLRSSHAWLDFDFDRSAFDSFMTHFRIELTKQRIVLKVW